MAAQQQAGARRRLLSIGQVLELLQGDFSDLTPSKLRFLEDQGLVTPERTQSGYRKFAQEHIERIRLILTLQRDHYLPLKVIAEVLADIDAGKDPVIPGASQRSASSILRPQKVLTGEELCRSAGASLRFLQEAVSAGLLPAAEVFPHECVAQLSSLVKLAERGIMPRHLRGLKVAAEREAELLGHAASTRGVKPGSPAAVEAALELATHLDTVRSGVLRRRVTRG